MLDTDSCVTNASVNTVPRTKGFSKCTFDFESLTLNTDSCVRASTSVNTIERTKGFSKGFSKRTFYFESLTLDTSSIITDRDSYEGWEGSFVTSASANAILQSVRYT